VCKKCQLKFSTGWFHHDGCVDGQPYYATTLLVCLICGTQHWVDHAETCVEERFSNAEREYCLMELAADQYPDRLLCALRPDFDGEKDTDVIESAAILLEQSCKLRPVRKLPSVYAGIKDKIATSRIACGYCKTTGTLIESWDVRYNKNCPNCGESMDDAVSFWMT